MWNARLVGVKGLETVHSAWFLCYFNGYSKQTYLVQAKFAHSKNRARQQLPVVADFGSGRLRLGLGAGRCGEADLHERQQMNIFSL